MTDLPVDLVRRKDAPVLAPFNHDLYGQAGGGLTIAPHYAEGFDWRSDGVTCGPDITCEAYEPRISGPCELYAVVELAAEGGRSSSLLCGKHYSLHRRGASVRLA